jgi:hypothetical protein
MQATQAPGLESEVSQTAALPSGQSESSKQPSTQLLVETSQASPAAQSAVSVQSTQLGLVPLTSQALSLPEQPMSVAPAPSSAHPATQNGNSPLASQYGATPPHPVSIAVPV